MLTWVIMLPPEVHFSIPSSIPPSITYTAGFMLDASVIARVNCDVTTGPDYFTLSLQTGLTECSLLLNKRRKNNNYLHCLNCHKKEKEELRAMATAAKPVLRPFGEEEMLFFKACFQKTDAKEGGGLLVP